MMTVNFAPYTRSSRLGHLDEDLQVIVVFPSERLKAVADCVLERNASRDDPFDRKSSACDHRDQTRSQRNVVPPASDEVQSLLAHLEHIDFRTVNEQADLSNRAGAPRRFDAKVE